MSNLTRRAILRGSTVAAVAAAADSAMPAIAAIPHRVARLGRKAQRPGTQRIRPGRLD
jgi:hypothetical protein